MSHCMLPTVTRPTRITESSATLLDNFFANFFLYFIFIIIISYYKSYILYENMSDHFPILLQVNLFKNCDYSQVQTKSSVYSSMNKTRFINELDRVDWLNFISVYSTRDDTSLLFKYFLSIFSGVFFNCFPMYIKPAAHISSSSVPWMSDSLIKC